MALLWHDSARLGATQATNRQVVGQGARGHEDGRLFAQHLGAALLEPFDRPTAREAIRRDAYFVLKSLELTHQPLGGLGFAIASQYHSNICIGRLWLHLITSEVTERTQSWSHLLGKEADGIEHALQGDAPPDIRLNDHAGEAKLVP